MESVISVDIYVGYGYPSGGEYGISCGADGRSYSRSPPTPPTTP